MGLSDFVPTGGIVLAWREVAGVPVGEADDERRRASRSVGADRDRPVVIVFDREDHGEVVGGLTRDRMVPAENAAGGVESPPRQRER